ncbi:MAG: alcohol dehydrogenase catalytic domain-containing protein [Actinomycetaceae bacterium]|nr:alcohol dehydrogenase catalytic domain-containing protein [Actinomycetaceae bacterium]
MLAAIFNGPGDLQLVDAPRPHANPGELVLRVGANTVCGTDGRILRGEKSTGMNPGVILGHEIAGYVEEIGKGVTGFDEGDLVGVLPTVPCLRCFYCQRGSEHLCTDSKIFGYALDGGLSEFIRIPAEAMERGGVFTASSHLTAVQVALAEPLGCVVSSSANFAVSAGDTVLVVGSGPIGLLHTQVARLRGAANIVVSDPSAPRRELAARLGATHGVDPAEESLEETVMGLTDGRGADTVILCIGVPDLVAQALKLVRKRGHVSAFAGFPKGREARIDPNIIHYGEIFVSGASNAGRASHARALELISRGLVDVASLHTHTFPLEKVFDGIEMATSGEGVKVAIVAE